MIRELFPSAIIAAPTNKAVSVLRSKGFSQATTLDKALKHSVYVEERRPPTDAEIAFYMAEKMPIPEYITVETYEKVDRTDGQPVLVVDEASMTNIDDFELAIGNYEKVIFVGDPFQLPPVSGEAWFQTCDPSVHLNEIVRTAADSEITLFATMLRQQDPTWKKHSWKREVTLIDRQTALGLDNVWTAADVVLAHQNITCDKYNSFLRMVKRLTNDADPIRPMCGDRLLAWQAIKDAGITKSDTYDVLAAGPVNGGYVVRLCSPLTGQMSLVAVNKAMLLQQMTGIQVKNTFPFSYGHCITGHKSQGSEWDHVVVLAHDKNRRHEDYWNWLYTACTRARKRLTVVI